MSFFVKSLLQMSLAGGVMIAAVTVVRALTLRRLPKRTFPVLWYAALARLLMPLSVPCVLSVYTLFARLNESPAAAEPAATAARPAAAPVAPVFSPVPPPAAVYEPVEAAPPAFSINGETVALLVWLLGALVCAAFFTVVYLRSRREFNQSLPLKNDFTRSWLDGHRLRRKISLRQSDRIGAPLTYGVARPVILMPKSTDWDDGEAVKYVLEHEFAHVRRFDAAGKLLLTAAVCLHWFNPLVWCMYVLANRDLELACDEAVLRRLGRETRAEYAMTLIRMAEAEGKNGPAPLCSGFGKSAVEERITAIMKMKKTSLAALLVAAGLVVGVTTVFATSAATADREELDRRANAQSVTSMDTVMSITGEDGKTWYSTDGGKTWISEEEFDAAYPKTEVEWWTYDEYAEWLENEKIELQDMLGEKGWTPSRGWFVWTQEEIDKSIAMYEDILRQIGRGAKVSKTVNGSEDTMLVQNPYDILMGIGEGEPTAADFAEYEPYGLEWSETEKALFFKGERVRYFIDGAELDVGMAVRFEYADAELRGDIDVRTVRSRVDNGDGSYDPTGPLRGLEKFSQAEYDENTFRIPALEAEAYTQAVIAEDEENTAAMLEKYVPFGLSYEFFPNSVGTLNMSYNGKPVHALSDAVACVWIANSMNGFYLGPDAVDLEAVYENGKLTGLKESPAPSAQAEASAAAAPTTTAIAQGGDTGKGNPGKTFAEKFDEYRNSGCGIQLYYEADSGSVYEYDSFDMSHNPLNKYLVSRFVDVAPDGSVFTFDSALSGGVTMQTVYGEDGKLAGVKVTEAPVTAPPVQEGETFVSAYGLYYAWGRGNGGCYVRASDIGPDKGLVPTYDRYGNYIGCYNNTGSKEFDERYYPNGIIDNIKFINGVMCMAAVGNGADGRHATSGYISMDDQDPPERGHTFGELAEYLRNHPDRFKEYDIPLYDGEGNVIGTFEMPGTYGGFRPSLIKTVDDAIAYLESLEQERLEQWGSLEQ